MGGSESSRMHQKYLNLCSEDERRSYMLGTTWGWVINDRIFIFGWTIPLTENWKYKNKKVGIQNNNIITRGRPIHRFCRLIVTDSWLPQLSVISKKKHADSFPFFAFLAGVAEKGPLALYSTRAASRGGNHWQHVLFIWTRDTVRCTERETPDSHLNTADRKSCRGTEHHSHSFY